MYKIIIILNLMFICNEVYSQVRYEKSKANKLCLLQYSISDSDIFEIKFDIFGQVSEIGRSTLNKTHGYQFYFTKNRLDSILRFEYGKKCNEKYLINEDGYLSKSILPNGLDMDSFFYFNKRKSMSEKPVKLSSIGLDKVYVLNNFGVLSNIYDCDSLNNYVSGYSIYLASNGYSISSVINQNGEVIKISNGNLEGIYYYRVDSQIVFKIVLKHRSNGEYFVRDLTLLNEKYRSIETIRFNKNGKIRGNKLIYLSN